MPLPAGRGEGGALRNTFFTLVIGGGAMHRGIEAKINRGGDTQLRSQTVIEKEKDYI